MHFYKFSRTEKFDHDYRANTSQDVYIIVIDEHEYRNTEEEERDARKILVACCAPQNKTSNPSFDKEFFNSEYFSCEILTENYVTENYPEIPENPKEVRFPRVDEHYWAIRPSKFK